jgi:hypothetical protein
MTARMAVIAYATSGATVESKKAVLVMHRQQHPPLRRRCAWMKDRETFVIIDLDFHLGRCHLVYPGRGDDLPSVPRSVRQGQFAYPSMSRDRRPIPH